MRVEGTGRSNGGFKDNSKVVDAKEGVDYMFVSGNSKVSDVKNTASYSTGRMKLRDSLRQSVINLCSLRIRVVSDESIEYCGPYLLWEIS